MAVLLILLPRRNYLGDFSLYDFIYILHERRSCMIIEIYGDAQRLLEHFIIYATGPDWKRLAHAMYYDEIGFRNRVRLLAALVQQATSNETTL